ncbi:MAG: VOC family protein [Dehalococcoidia bacterium]
MVGLDSDDLDADSSGWRRRAVEFIEPPTDYTGLRIATLRDPEGNIVQLYQPVS